MSGLDDTVWDNEYILQNKIETPDGTILQSWFRHDFVEYIDKNGETYMVDGGTTYLRRYVVAAHPFIERSLYYKAGDHQHNRGAAYWGSYWCSDSEYGHSPLKRILIKDLANDHVRAILRDCSDTMSACYKSMMQRELEFRGVEGELI